jgi:hypothetical protein
MSDDFESVRYDDPRGTLEVLRVHAHCSVFVARGHLTRALADAMVAEGLRVAASGRAVALHDWSQLKSYDSEARQRCTAFMVAHRRDFAEVTILVTSAIVAMGVNVANIGLGGFMHATTDHAGFAARVDLARGRNG